MFLIYTHKSQQIGVQMTHKADHMEGGDKWNFKDNKMCCSHLLTNTKTKEKYRQQFQLSCKRNAARIDKC